MSKQLTISGYHDHPVLWSKALRAGLEDDDWVWDWTTAAALRTGGDPLRPTKARVIAKEDGVWAADGLLEAVESLAREYSLPVRVRAAGAGISNGAVVRKGTVVVEWDGPLRAILTFERPFLNLASFVGGIAGRTARLVQAVDQGWKAKAYSETQKPRLTSTRKTLPGYRDLSVLGVLAGGGMPHRTSLSGGVLIKENHIALAGGIAEAIAAARSTAPHGLKIEVEVRNHAELCEALTAHADAVLLDNFTHAQARESIDWVRKSAPGTIVEVSGGISEDSIGGYLIEGVHVISSGALTHSVRAWDLSLLVQGT